MKLPLGTSMFSVQYYTFLNTNKIMIDIKAHELVDGVGDIKDSIVAFPVGVIGSCGNKEFRTIGETIEKAVYACAEKLKDITDINQVFSESRQ